MASPSIHSGASKKPRTPASTHKTIHGRKPATGRVIKRSKLTKFLAKVLVVFDLDDTLMYNVHLYAYPILDTVRLIVKTLGHRAPHVSKIVELEHQIGLARRRMKSNRTGKPIGYSIERSIGALVETYRQVCAQVGVRPLKKVEWKIREIGMGAFNENLYRRNIHPQAKRIIRFLRKHGAEVFLCTKGEEGVQFKKIAALKRAGVFKDGEFGLEVVPDKTPRVFREIAAKYPGYRLYVVGNSYASDIQPALKACFRGIYIPVETFETMGRMSEIMGRVDRKRCAVLTELPELKDWLTRRHGN